MNSPAPEAPTPDLRPPEPRVRVLWVTTKCPWPAIDGGRLLVAQTLQALDPEAIDVTLVGPWAPDAAQERVLRDIFPVVSRIVAATAHPTKLGELALGARIAAHCAASMFTARAMPVTALKHQHPALSARLAELLDASCFDVIHVEQPHAMGPLPATNIPIVLRAQNVETDLWRRYAAALPWPQRFLVNRQARAVARWEQAVAVRARSVLAISEEDRLGFERLGLDPEQLEWLPPPVPQHLERPSASQTGLSGAPPLVLFGGSSWRPNQIGERAFIDLAWPAISQRHPGAVLNTFGLSDRRPRPKTLHHSAPNDSSQALVEGTILVVPATVTSGVRMKILEAFARGVCVITSDAGARGLSTTARQAIAIAQTPGQWADAVAELAPLEARKERAEAGRLALAVDHDPVIVGGLLLSCYQTARN